MRTNRQTLLHDLPTLETFLGRETGIDSYNLVPSISSFDRKESEELPPSGITNRFGKMMVFHHATNSQVFDDDHAVLIGILFGDLKMMIAPLPFDLQVCLGGILGGNAPAVTALLASAHRSLLASECALRGAIVTRIVNGVALAIGQEGLETDINPDRRMVTGARGVFIRWLHLAHNESVPVSIGTKDQVSGFGRTFKRAVQFDLERGSQLRWDKEVFAVKGKQHIASVLLIAVLSQLNTVPSVWLLKTRKTTRNTQLLARQKAFEGFGESIRKALYRGCRDMLCTAFKCFLKLILVGESPLLLILCLDHLKHLIIDATRFNQARHEQVLLFLLHKKAVLTCVHAHILRDVIRTNKMRQFTLCLKTRGPLAAFS